MTATDYVEAMRLNWFRGSNFATAPTTLYLGALTAAPAEAGTGVAEHSGDGYARIPVVYGAASGRVITTTVDHTFAAATGDWTQVTHWGWFDAITGGNLLAFVAMDAAEDVTTGSQLVYPTGSTISVTGNVTNYLANAWLNWYRGTAMPAAPANIYGALSSTTPVVAGTGITEESGNGYAREIVAFDAPVQGANAGTVANSAIITWGPASADWTDVTYGVLFDAITAGNALSFGPLAGTQSVNNGSSATAGAGTITVAAA